MANLIEETDRRSQPRRVAARKHGEGSPWLDEANSVIDRDYVPVTAPDTTLGQLWDKMQAELKKNPHARGQTPKQKRNLREAQFLYAIKQGLIT